MEEITIIHLSDTHLGRDYVWRSWKRRRLRWWKTESEKLLAGLEKALREVSPDYVIVSGDVVNKCTRHNFDRAARTLRNIFANANIDVKTKVLVIPGNHDVKVLPEENEYFGRLAEFVRFLKIFFDEKHFRSRTENFITVDPDRKLCFFCLDSTLKTELQLAEGEVGSAQWDWFKAKCQKLGRIHPDFDRFIKIVALHHHPDPIEGGGQERFMQLLDAGTAAKVFEGNGVNIVLHGHKHFPHASLHHFEGGRHYTVIGAGTATCPFLEEQAGQGNSFNVIKLSRRTNLLELYRWTADNDKQYRPTAVPVRFSLFQPSEIGYKMSEFRSITKILDLEGSCFITSERVGLVVDKADLTLKTIGFRVGSTATDAEIVAFEYDTKCISDVKYEENQRSKRKGHFVLRNELRWGSDPIDLWFTYEMKGSFCMQRSHYETIYPGKPGFIESVGMRVVRPCDQLTVSVEFPAKYAVDVRAQASDENGAQLEMEQVAHSLLVDRLANRRTLVVRKPQLQHRYGVAWEVPE